MSEIGYLNINKELFAIVENYGWDIGTTYTNGGEYDTEISQRSPAGEDFSFCVYHDNTNTCFVNAVRRAADDFDKEEHVKMWVNSNMGGIPDVETLVEDAKAIQEMLEALAEALEDKLEYLQRLADKYVKLAEEALSHAMREVTGLGQTPYKRKQTYYLNAEYYLGQYQAFMELLEEVDFQACVEMHEETKEGWDIIVKEIEHIYEL